MAIIKRIKVLATVLSVFLLAGSSLIFADANFTSPTYLPVSFSRPMVSGHKHSMFRLFLQISQPAPDYSSLQFLFGTEVAVTTTDGMIDGNWLLDTFEASRDNPYPNWDCTIMLIKRSKNIVYG